MHLRKCLNSRKRLITLFCIGAITLISSLAFLAVPEQAYALGGCPNTPVPPTPVLPVVPVLDTELLKVSTVTQVSTLNLSTKECILNGLFKMIAAAIVHEITSSIIDWINNGFEGGPTFVTDPAGFFGNIADQELGRFIDASQLGFVCDPFRIDLQFAFLSQRNRYRPPSRCTITGIIKNVTGFVGGDFRQGGWPGWFSLTQNPSNNPYGEFDLANEQLQARISSRQNLAAMQLNWGRGFKSILNKAGMVQTPGALIQDSLSKATNNDLDYLNLSREFDDIMIALVNAGITQVMKFGLGH